MVITLDFASNVPIYQQVRDQIVQIIADGTLAPGDRLPTIRALAQEIGVNTMTVNKAYQLLKQDGYILADRRSGAIVADTLQQHGRLPGNLRDNLSLLIAEAKLHGVDETQFLEICKNIYRGDEL